jgi:hypothetical protein
MQKFCAEFLTVSRGCNGPDVINFRSIVCLIFFLKVGLNVTLFSLIPGRLILQTFCSGDKWKFLNLTFLDVLIFGEN